MDETPKKGQVVASFMGRITLRDPNPDDVSRANRPIVPGAPSVKAVEEAIIALFAEQGFAVSVDLTDTTR